MFLEDGRVEMDSNTFERTIRPIALNRKDAPFAGSNDGGDNWAIITSLLETAKLNAVDPLAWLTDTLERLAGGHSSKNLDQLMRGTSKAEGPWGSAYLRFEHNLGPAVVASVEVFEGVWRFFER